MTIKEAISKRIIELCKKNNITINKLSTMAGLTQSTLNDVVNGKSKNPTVRTIYLVCFGLGIELKDFFDSNLFFDLIDG
ncbi:helix-turn-helix domain-containing protein [Maledivibacter halophilus]|uniref:Predicted transcriptional regulators n=1 Tax=Maledivibacter halophilus TaxID=36842 RepID=A0A1T5K0I8_9FIRM|nr:helix-turn-helix transcriptional regulator [Maledivibacter halophilus]SKC57008.1 Predicted transcriptional regulators [Maledivibacter halophilus]